MTIHGGIVDSCHPGDIACTSSAISNFRKEVGGSLEYSLTRISRSCNGPHKSSITQGRSTQRPDLARDEETASRSSVLTSTAMLCVSKSKLITTLKLPFLRKTMPDSPANGPAQIETF